MRREISEAKPMEAKMHIGLDDVVKRSFERLQKRMQSIKETDMSTLPITLEGCLQPKETCI